MTKKFWAIVLMGVALSACAAPSPYEAGRSPADVASHVDVINLKKVFLYGGEAEDPMKGAGPHRKPEPLVATDPSQNDLEVLSVAKANIVSQLTNLGYTIVENGKGDADIGLSFAVTYMPERILFVHRQVGVVGLVYNKDDDLLFSLGSMKASAAGAFGSAFQSRDDLVSSCAREAVVKVTTEMRKGTLENVSVARKQVAAPDQAATSQPIPNGMKP